MRSETFLSAAELGLTPTERRVAIELLYRLEAGEILFEPHGRLRNCYVDSYDRIAKFNMVDVVSGCGTVGCLLGWLRHLSKDPLAFNDARHESTSRAYALDDLFCMGPPVGGGTRGKEVEAILPHEAAAALRNFLNGSLRPWDGVFGARPS